MFLMNKCMDVCIDDSLLIPSLRYHSEVFTVLSRTLETLQIVLTSGGILALANCLIFTTSVQHNHKFSCIIIYKQIETYKIEIATCSYVI